ncbi:MAG: SpoIID/LytB domain-containing protein [Bacteroidales bacterium]
MAKYIIVLGLLVSWINTSAQKLSISLFNDIRLSTILITPTKGNYKLITGDVQENLHANQILYLTRAGDSIMVRDANRNLGTWKRVSIVGDTNEDIIRVKPIIPAKPARLYDDNLSFYVEYDRIMAINLIDEEKYIAAVVEAEGGPNRDDEFYKAQALIARTYTFKHLQKHNSEGFNLCDGVHCQAYKGRSEMDEDIYTATSDTKDLIIVDSLNRPITAAFHANCGGETANSGDVWIESLPYLVSVPDRFCTNSRSATWERRVPLKEWKKFLSEQGVDTLKIGKHSEMNFDSHQRAKNYTAYGVTIPTTKIRSQFKLRSAWFSIFVYKTEVRFSGRGYGHGVGLCQDGAINMASRGWTYDKIIEYYYKGVKIVSEDSVDVSNMQPDTLNVEDHAESDTMLPPPDQMRPPM